MSEPALSVVLAAKEDSRELRRLVASLTPRLAEIGGELVIADGSPAGLPADVPVGVRLPGADVFTLRAEGVRAAGGRIIALSEDHCLPDDAWCAAVLRAHDEHPHVAAVSGCMANGSVDHLADRANFYATFAPFVAPITPGGGGRVAPAVNVSIKRESLAGYGLPPGQLELEIVPHLQRVGHLVFDERIRQVHFKRLAVPGLVRLYFHNGRASASLPRRSPPLRERVVRIGHSLLLPWRMGAATLAQLARKPGHRRTAARAAPMILLLLCCHALGQIAGIVAGPGGSAAAID